VLFDGALLYIPKELISEYVSHGKMSFKRDIMEPAQEIKVFAEPM
jgi:hypothetical protein